MKNYVINLDRATERWSHITDQFKALNLIPTRVSAVDGKTLALQNENIYQRGLYRDLNNSEIACFLSHIKCWQMIVDNDDDYAFVFEDDVHLSSQLPEFIKAEFWRGKVDLLSIEQFFPDVHAQPKPILNNNAFSIYEVVHDNPGTGGYLVSKKMAKILLEHSSPFYYLVDSYLFSPRRIITALYGSYQLNPALCTQGFKNQEFMTNNYVHPSSMYVDKTLAHSSLFAKKI